MDINARKRNAGLGTGRIASPPKDPEETFEVELSINLPIDDAALAEFEEPLHLDSNSLDDAAMQHAQLYHTVGQRCVLAESLRDQAKEQLALIDAQMAGIVRAQIEEQKERATEARVADGILQTTEHLQAALRLSQAHLLAARWRILQSSMDTRGRMIGHLVQLYMGEYFTRNTAGGAERSMTDKQAEEGRAGMRGARMKKAGLAP